ncbi:MAG: 50S ribosomal protein L18 [Patescibacteria group bacterium]
MENSKRQKRIRRHKRVRARVSGTAIVPRISVFRSNRHIFVQAVDDSIGKTLVSSKIVSEKKSKMKGKKTDLAGAIGKSLADKLKEAGVTRIVFDRGGYKYHGRVKALAEGLRKGGIKF